MLPAEELDEAPLLEVVEAKPKRAPAPHAREVGLAAKAFTQVEQLELYRKGIESLRELAEYGNDTARTAAATKLATIFRDAANTKAGRVQTRVLFVDPRELVDAPEPVSVEADDFIA